MFLIDSQFVIYFDIASFSLLTVILLSIFIKGIYRQKENKLFITLVVLCMLTAFFDIMASLPQYTNFKGIVALDTIYFIFRVSIPLLYLLYLINLTHVGYKFNNILKKGLILIPYLAMIIVIIINIFNNGLFFYIESETLDYSRSSIFFIMYIEQGFYLALGLFLIITRRKIFNFYQILTLIAIVPLTVGASLVQFFFNDLLVELFCQTIAIYLISSSIETKEMLIDNRTKLSSFQAFRSFTKRTFINKRETHILLLKVTNYSELYNLLPYETANKYLREMSSNFANRFKGIDDKYHAYYLDEGLYAAISYDYNKLRKIAVIMNQELGLKSAIVEYIPKKSICLLSIPKVFDNEQEFLKFINNFHTKFGFDDEIIYLNEIYQTNEFIVKNNLDSILEVALKENEFEVYYQPIYNIKENKYTSAEALVRLNSKKYGFIYPNLFIKYAEKIGKIADIDRKVFYQVLEFIQSDIFDSLGIEYIEINLSILEFIDKNILVNMPKAFNDRNIPFDKLNIEITESATAENYEMDYHIIELAKRGIRLSLDDYGTGYSNIERFSKLPFTLIKVDKSLVDDSEKENMQRILKNTFSMIKDLGRKSVVEGVETKEQAERFIKYGCDYIQGYYYSKPLPLNEFKEFIKKENFK